MKQIKNKQELNLVSHIKESAELVLRDINSTTKLNPHLFDQGEDKMLSNLGKNCENLIKEFHLLEDKNLLSLIKNGNTILVNTTDAISFYEDRYYHVLDEKPDWRGMIKFSTVKVGHGDNGSWISYEEIDFIDKFDFIKILKTYKHSLVDYEKMNKYIQFTKTIPE